MPVSGKVTLIEGDILEARDLELALNKADAVIHLAAITDAASSFADPARVELVNAEGTRRVIAACRENTIGSLIFPSTTSVYGPMNGIAREDSPESELQPQSPYATSKLAAERASIMAPQRGEICGVVLRLGTIFGPSPGMRFHTAVNRFIWQAAIGQPLTVWSNAVGLVRPYLALTDALSAFEFVLLRAESLAGVILNVVTLNATLDRVLAAVRSHAPRLEIRYTESPLLNQVSYHVDDSKLRALGYTYTGNLEAGVKETFEYLAGVTPAVSTH